MGIIFYYCIESVYWFHSHIFVGLVILFSFASLFSFSISYFLCLSLSFPLLALFYSLSPSLSLFFSLSYFFLYWKTFMIPLNHITWHIRFSWKMFVLKMACKLSHLKFNSAFKKCIIWNETQYRYRIGKSKTNENNIKLTE